MSGALAAIARREGAVPLAWAGGTTGQDYLNLGDALSAAMVAMLSGLPVRRTPFRSRNPRLAAVGTIGQNLEGGEVWFWGTGCSSHAGSPGKRARYSPDPGMRAHVAATRGPLSATLIGGGRLATRVFGDPVWLLPRFHRPAIEKRWELGVIVHLSDLADRATECHPKPEIARYAVPADGSVRLINTVVDISTAAMGARIDEILACRRIVSTSLHGMVFAESYGIPCLCFPPTGPAELAEIALEPEAPLDLRMIDLYMGLGRTRLPVWSQPRGEPTDWDAVISAIDRAWIPAALDEEALTAAFPIDLAPLSARPGETIWQHPVLNAFPYAHDVAALRRADAAAAEMAADAEAAAGAGWTARLRGWRLPAVAAAEPPARLRLRAREGMPAVIPLSWAAGSADATQVNIGDALSAVIVAAMTGLPVKHVAFDRAEERLAAVGTIAHGQRRGTVHLWGTGLDRTVNTVEPGAPWRRPPDTAFHVHATRGPFTAATLRREGIAAPEIFGDPVSFVPRIWPLLDVEKTCELGVVLHLTERAAGFSKAEGPTAARSELRRYAIPSEFAGRVRLIDTLAAPTLDAFEAKLREIASCRAILSTSLHGLVIADAYGIPSAWFGFGSQGLVTVDPLDPGRPLDHRVRDLYAGQGLGAVPVVLTHREQPSDWDSLIGWMSEIPPRRAELRPLFNAFPGPLSISWDESRWPVPRGLIEAIP